MKVLHVHCRVRDLPGAVRWFEQVWQVVPVVHNEQMAWLGFGEFGVLLDAAPTDSVFTLGFDNRLAKQLAFVESLPASGTASMQRDFTDGKPSELEEIIGAVVRLGDKRGVPTPTMDCVYASLLPQELRARGGLKAVAV
ncbi:MAG: ketopantoate reductase family protein [Terriglobia bacterium]